MMMKFYKTFILLILLISGTLHSETPGTVFDEGNKLYINAEYNKALNKYLEVYKSGYSSSELMYNIGNCYYKLENYPKAQLFYYRSLKLNPHNRKAKFNLEKTKLYNVDKLDEIPEFFLKSWIRGLHGMFTSNTWAYGSIIVFVLSLISFATYFMVRYISLRKAGFWLGVLFISLSLLMFIFAYQSKRDALYTKEGVIISPTVIIKNSPDIDEKDKYILHEGLKATITDSLGNWYEIRLSDGKDGWIQKNELEII
jgi:tetratricopeptide (TPR) repeat protein